MPPIISIIGITLALCGTSAPSQEIRPYDKALDLYRRGEFVQASVLLESELNTTTADEIGLRSLLGWCRYRQGRHVEALSAFNRVLALAPDNPDALEGVARSASRAGRDKQALDAVAALVRLHPDVDLRDVADQVLSRPGSLEDIRLGRGRKPAGEPGLVARARGDYLEVRHDDAVWAPLFVKGVNLGAALPGRYPAEFPRDQALYEKWLLQMSGMGANAVRLYTLLPPEFYRALSAHNAGRSSKDGFIWLVQGVWTELPEDDVSYDAPEFRHQFFTEMERVIDAIHGNIAVVHRRGHAFGLYDTDVSNMTLGFVLGREWEPYSVAAYDQSRPHPASYKGTYFTLDDGTPTEAWFAGVLDHAVDHEMRHYHAQHPVSFTNWPTLDPIHHPTEATKDEEVALLKKLNLPQEPGTLLEYDNDGAGIDAMKIVPTNRSPAGTFASYHAYPYYPDFMNVDPGYLKSKGARGPSNYAGYLRELKTHHRGMPVLIAEVGVPTSRGIAHHQPQGWHHGGHTEKEQGLIDAILMEDIQATGCAGGILFAWIDEWFKKNWLVVAFEVPWDNNKNWLNILDPEQNYGLMALKPGASEWKITIDGKGDDWKTIAPIAVGRGEELRSLRVTHDEAYIYIRIDVARIEWRQKQIVLGIDTYGAAEGDHRMPFDLGLSTPTGMEFVVDLSGPSTSRVLCDLPYDLHTNRFTRPWKSSKNADGLFTEMLAETNRRRIGRDGTIYPAIVYSRSPLRYGTMDPASPDYDDLVEWNANPEEGFIELRIGWNLLNVTDPSTRQVLDDPVPPKGGAGHRTTDGFRFYLASWHPGNHRVLDTIPAVAADGEFLSKGIPFYTWESWDEPTWHSYLKKSYFILKERLAPLEPLVRGGNSSVTRRVIRPLALACALLLAPDLPRCQTDQATPEQNLSSADREFANDNYSSAESLYEKTLAAQPDNTHATSRLALLLTWRGEYERAIVLYNKALTLEPGNVEIRRGLATAYCWSEQYPRALRIYKDLLSERPGDEGLLLEKAQAEAWSGNLKSAQTTLDLLLERNPRHVKGRVLHAQVRQWSGDLTQAELIFKSVIADGPPNAPAEAGLCEVLNSAGRHTEAMPHCDAALAIDPKNRVAMTGRARALQSEGRTPEALDTVREALALYPDARDTRRLGSEIGGPLRPTLKLYGNTLQDTEDNDLATWGGTYTHFLSGRGYVGVSFMHAQTDAKIDRVVDPGPPERTTSATPVAKYDTLRITGGWHQSKFLSLYAEAGAERTSFPFPDQTDPLLVFPADPNSSVTNESTSHPAGSATIEVNPAGWFTIVGTASVERLVGTTQAFMNDVGIKAAALTALFRPHPRLRLRLTGQKAKFTDDHSYDVDSGFHVLPDDGEDNERDLVSASASWRLPFRRPAVSLNYNFRWMSYDHDLDHGYFDPDRFLSHIIGFDISDTIGRHFYWGGGVDRGIQWIDDEDARDVLGYRVLAGVNMTDAASLEAYYARSDSSLAAAAGFRSSEGGVRIRISFGGSLGPASPGAGPTTRPNGASN